MLSLPVSPRRRRPSLTPMIDVVFLLLVFFMLVARFGGGEGLSLLLAAPDGQAPYSGPPRLVTVLPEALHLNGQPVADLAEALRPLMKTPEEVILLRPGPGTDIARMVAVMADLKGAGLSRLAVVE